MNKIFFLLGLAVMATDVFGSPAINVRFDLSFTGMGKKFFINVPHTLELIKKNGYVQYDRPTADRKTLVMYCNSTDLTICPLVDSNGNPGGVQVAIEKGMFVNTTLDWETRGFSTWEAEENGTLKEFWVQTQYFMSESYLALSDEERQEKYNSDKLLQDAVWLTGMNKELMEVPDSVSGITGCGFTEQNCVVWMGRHYFYNMTADTECTSEYLFPYFTLEQSGSIIGVGLMFTGVPSITINRRVWHEQPPKVAVQFIVNNGPSCLPNLADDPGVITIHIYYTSDPYFNLCLPFIQ